MVYLDDMPSAYAAADLALCRSGALSCAELAAVGLPAIYVPLPIGNGEQRLNAEGVVAAGGALLIADDELDAGVVGQQVTRLLTDESRLARMTAAAAGGGHRDAAAALVAMIGEAYAAHSPRIRRH
jgi:UDP-N-acetylglucosamine--N-acetylmuramyl-(pentapeptide) pyrophosphoryl-undecaprenol N-acetylglucosamine transferase